MIFQGCESKIPVYPCSRGRNNWKSNSNSNFHVMPDRYLMGVPVAQRNCIQQSVRSFKSL